MAMTSEEALLDPNDLTGVERREAAFGDGLLNVEPSGAMEVEDTSAIGIVGTAVSIGEVAAASPAVVARLEAHEAPAAAAAMGGETSIAAIATAAEDDSSTLVPAAIVTATVESVPPVAGDRVGNKRGTGGDGGSLFRRLSAKHSGRTSISAGAPTIPPANALLPPTTAIAMESSALALTDGTTDANASVLAAEEAEESAGAAPSTSAADGAITLAPPGGEGEGAGDPAALTVSGEASAAADVAQVAAVVVAVPDDSVATSGDGEIAISGDGAEAEGACGAFLVPTICTVCKAEVMSVWKPREMRSKSKRSWQHNCPQSECASRGAEMSNRG